MQQFVNVCVFFFPRYRASVLKMAIKSKNQILRHLNHVVNISFLLMSDENADAPVQEKPLRCHAETSWSRLLQKDSLSLVCVLHNSSPFVLERGWTLSITVFPLSRSSSAGGESSNFSFPFHNLHPGETFEVSLPVADASDASFPMTVSCSLVFSLSGLLGEEEEASFPSCISLPLTTLTVDWLHALQVNAPTAPHKTDAAQPSSTAADAIQTFLSSRRLRCSGGTDRGGESASKPELEKYSASVRVSSEFLRDHFGDLRPSLLEWLLSEELGGVKPGYQGDEIASNTSVVHARGPNGASVTLTAKEVKHYLM